MSFSIGNFLKSIAKPALGALALAIPASYPLLLANVAFSKGNALNRFLNDHIPGFSALERKIHGAQDGLFKALDGAIGFVGRLFQPAPAPDASPVAGVPTHGATPVVGAPEPRAVATGSLGIRSSGETHTWKPKPDFLVTPAAVFNPPLPGRGALPSWIEPGIA